MIKIKNLKLMSILTGVALSSFVYANNPTSANMTQPSDLQKVPSSIVTFDADWCPVCQEQKKILSSLLKQDKYKNIKLYQVNFDTQKNILKNFKVSMQSTIISYKNGKEMLRSTGETNTTKITKILDKSL